ncbi:hypothetical protein [Rummeliibacillus stabekisii]|uniref:hypothetical protein n=1 Tax=Rummeliibacillus stabekisii TaxID=241244 RepID=UPI001171C4FC|nr:hypothetical protein [Rummeliibacillus stabekisii]MBB5171598.1 hypothetical protein [Rummeliibacillus stabekisii]GEL05445.1 hypothetical protein RST01_20720 [Rummeliibacillus stabekisii]
MKNFFKLKAPIIMMGCFFLFTQRPFNVQAVISEDITDQEIKLAKACTLIIDANKHIGEIKKFAEAEGSCNGQVQGYYLKANDSFNIRGAINEFVNFNGEKFNFLIEPSGSLAIVTVKLIEPIKPTIHTKKRKGNLVNYKEKHQTVFDINEYLEENQKASASEEEDAIKSSDQVTKENKYEKKVSVEEKKERQPKNKFSAISMVVDLLIILAIIVVLCASYFIFKNLKNYKGE